jgi:Zn-finger nucleic acid-binding protein
MKCPRTGTPLKTLKVGGIAIEISEACGGLFFDNLELDKFNNSDEIRGSALAKHVKQFNRKLPNEKDRIKCPKCKDIVMMRRYYSPLKVVEIDECPGCASIWLDPGELEQLQDIKLSKRE